MVGVARFDDSGALIKMTTYPAASSAKHWTSVESKRDGFHFSDETGATALGTIDEAGNYSVVSAEADAPSPTESASPTPRVPRPNSEDEIIPRSSDNTRRTR